jgi:hypothetical protein
MRHQWMFIAMALASLAGCYGRSSTTSQTPENESLSTITGRYSYIGNPCTTEPCLPGMTYAVLANDKYYYITIDECWFSENQSWDGYTPEMDDLVTVTGCLREKKDVFGKPFYTMEVVSLQPAK